MSLSPRSRVPACLRLTTIAMLASGVLASIGGAQEVPPDAPAWAKFNAKTPPAATEHYSAPGNPLQELDIYSAAAATAPNRRLKPVLMLVHGGGWGGGTRDALAPHARYFAALGWECINISYRLTRLPGVTLMNAQDDVRAAFDWIRTQAAGRGWDANRIVLLGESAGGQLACAIGVLPPSASRWQAHALVLVNPVLDLTSLTWALDQPGLREAGVIAPGNRNTHPAFLVSPLFHVNRSSPSTLLIHGRDDNVVPFAQAESYAAAAKSAGAKLELVALEKTNHAFLLQEFGSPEVIRATLQRIAQFIGAP